MNETGQQRVNVTHRRAFGESRDNQRGDTTSRVSQNQNQMSEYREPSVKSLNESVKLQALLNFFDQYKPQSDLVIEDIHKSETLKLKRYKQCIYYGEFINNKRNGKGIMVYHNNRLYEGQWEEDFKHGKGFQKFANGSKYDGFYVNGKPEGVGTYIWPNGELYEGEWINGLKHGSGMWRGSKGDSYIGQWKFGKADGYGVHTWVNGDRYEGQFKACLKHGEGTEKFGNGDLYIGSYVNGKPSGYGQYYWANGSFFKGSFNNGLRHGNGVWKRGPGNSDKYEGQYANDKKCGYGIFTWVSGNVYKGDYFDDLRHGYGEMYWHDQSWYKGMWEKGIQHGQGEIKLPGEAPKKGIFQQNVLVSLQQTNQSNNNYDQRQEYINNHLKNLNQERPYVIRGQNYYSSRKMNPNNIQSNYEEIRNVKFQKTTNFKQKELFSKSQKSHSSSNKFSQGPTTSLKNQMLIKSHHLNPIITENARRPNSNLQKIDLVSAKQKVPHSSFFLHQISKGERYDPQNIIAEQNKHYLIKKEELMKAANQKLDQNPQQFRIKKNQTGPQGIRPVSDSNYPTEFMFGRTDGGFPHFISKTSYNNGSFKK